MRTAGFAGTPGPSGGAPGTPRAKLAARFEDDAPASPMRRQASSLSKGGSARSLMATGGGEALQAARAEIEQLKKLCAAHDVIREGLEKRVAQLEAQLQRQNAAPSGAAAASVPGPGGAAPLAAGAMASDGERKEPTPSLFTDDGRDFDNYIRRLAGLSELEAPKDARDKQHVAVRVGTDAKSKRRPAVHTQGQKGEKEVVYEVTCYTSDVPGAGTTSNCYITLRGQGGEFGPCALDRADAHSAVPGVGVLAQKATDVFDIVAVNVEPLHSIIISHDMSGSAPSWHLRTMTLRRHRSSSAEAKTYRFEWDNWVGPPQGSPATSPPSITLFPEMVNKDSGDPGHSGLQARPRTAPGAAGRAHGASGAGAAAAGARGEGRLTLHPAALSDACKSMVSAIRELHLPSTVSHDSGLQRLARLLGMGGASAAGGSRIEVPAGSRNLSVAFFGPRHVCTELVEWYGGCKMSDTGLSTKARFTLVKALPSGHHASGAGTYLLGQDGKGELGHFAGLADEVPALLSSLAVAQVPTGNMRMAQVDLVHPPVIEGPPPASAPSSFLEEALGEVRDQMHSKVDSLASIFKEMDKDGNGLIDVAEWTSALTQLGLDIPGPRAERMFKALDVSSDGSIEYGEFLAVFKPALTTYPYDLEAAAEGVGAEADLIIVLVDPKTIHFNARELALIARLHTRFPNKLRLACYVREPLREDSKLRSHLLPATRLRLEQAMGLPANALLGHLPNLWVPSAASSSHAVVDNQLDDILEWVKDALLSLESLAVDQTEHNLRIMLDLVWSAGDSGKARQARAELVSWLKAWCDAAGRRKTPSFVRLHEVLDKALKDVKRGHVVREDVEGWTPKRVSEWLSSCNPALGQYAGSFEDEQVTGKRLMRVSEDVLKKKLHVRSLGHRKEIMRHLDALLRARKAYLKL
eukprot:Tamp_05601.p1 GENE.Tamp_05601~~Tamp_05601.p1  ORF type:complete len:940 (+),score=261.82 Tamp_05601:61-2820(+)